MAIDTAQQRITAAERAGRVIGTLKTIRFSANQLQAAVQLYQSNADPTFNAIFNALFTATDRQELATMIQQLTTLVADWETNHPWIAL